MTPERQRQEDAETQDVIVRVWRAMERQSGVDWAFWIFMTALIGGWILSEFLGLWG